MIKGVMVCLAALLVWLGIIRPKSVISFTLLDQYHRCRPQYWSRYGKGMEDAPSELLIQGMEYHAALEKCEHMSCFRS